jgi:ribonucleotide reductase beta subunit family protein with ferritin-like domain
MITKSKNRIIPKMMVDMNQLSCADLIESPQFQESVFIETYNSIKTAINNKKTEAQIFEINTSGTLITIEKNNWDSALQAVIDYYADKDDFEKCIEIKELQNKLYERPRQKRRAKESV